LKNMESYKNNLDKIQNISNGKNVFIDEVICNIRRKVAFHFDKHVIAKTLGEFVSDCIRDKEDIIFIEGKTDTEKDQRFRLADNLNLRYILGLINCKNSSYEEKFIIVAKELLGLSKLFCDILEAIIPEMVIDYCELVEKA